MSLSITGRGVLRGTILVKLRGDSVKLLRLFIKMEKMGPRGEKVSVL